MGDTAMKCDLCDKSAVVHEVTIQDGVKREVHLCETCARDAGVSIPAHKPIEQVLSQFVVSKPKRSRRSSAAVTCEGCGHRLADFRQSGLLGCAKCYETFERDLVAVIERAQNSGTAHAGKCPRRLGTSIDRQLTIQRLVRDLEHAVSSEQFERAAELRDRLSTLESNLKLPEDAEPTADAEPTDAEPN